jgi:hypothetical protein
VLKKVAQQVKNGEIPDTEGGGGAMGGGPQATVHELRLTTGGPSRNVTNTLRLIAFAVSTALFFNLLSCFTSVEIARGVRGMNSASMRLLRASEVMHYSTALVGAPTPALQAVARSSLRGSVEQMQTLFVRLQQETSTSQINLFFKREPRVLSVLTGQGSVGKGNITSVLQQNTLDSVASFFMRKASSLASEPDSELGLLNQDYEDTATLYKNVLVAGLQDSTAIYHMELSQQVACVYQILHCLAERQGLEVIFCLSLTVRLIIHLSPPHSYLTVFAWVGFLVLLGGFALMYVQNVARLQRDQTEKLGRLGKMLNTLPASVDVDVMLRQCR